MITVNLLPTSAVKQLKLLRLRKFFLIRVLILSFYGFLIAGGLSATLFLLTAQNRHLEEQLVQRKQEEKTAKFLEVQQKINIFNQNLQSVAKLQERHTVITPILVELSRLTPATIRLTALRIAVADQSAQLTGLAQTRDVLLLYQKALEESNLFLEVASPLSNLTNRENVEFSLQFKIDLKPSGP